MRLNKAIALFAVCIILSRGRFSGDLLTLGQVGDDFRKPDKQFEAMSKNRKFEKLKIQEAENSRRGKIIYARCV